MTELQQCEKERKRKANRKLCYINRQPSLWRHSCPAVEIIPDFEKVNVISVSPLMIEPLNADFDGDTAAIYLVHDEEALIETEDNAYLLNNIKYDQNDNYLACIRHEAVYAAYVMTFSDSEILEAEHEISSLDELEISLEYLNDYLYTKIKCGNTYTTYGRAVFNRWCGFKDIKINKTITKKEANYVSDKIYEDSKDNEEYYRRLTTLENHLFTFITISKYTASISLQDMISIKDEETRKLLNKIPVGIPRIGMAICTALRKRCIDNMPKDSQLIMLLRSGSRFNQDQLARSCIALGYVADAKNMIIDNPIPTSLLEGLTEEEFFLSAYGTRKSIVDQADQVPQSGYLERTLVFALSGLTIAEEDCGSSGLEISVISEDHAKMLVDKYYYNENGELTLITKDNCMSLVGKNIRLRSLMACLTGNYKICRICFGNKKLRTTNVGFVAGQNITERLTQLTLRTFHTSGQATSNDPDQVIGYIQKHLIDIEDCDNQVKLVFNDTLQTDVFVECYKELIDRVETHNNESHVYVNKSKSELANQDVTHVLKSIKKIMRKDENFTSPKQYYEDTVRLISQVGTIYSSFIEALFCNTITVKPVKGYTNKPVKKQNRIDYQSILWRYNQNLTPVYKVNIYQLTHYIDPLLNLMYMPNENSILNLEDDAIYDSIMSNALDNIYHKIWLEKLVD